MLRRALSALVASFSMMSVLGVGAAAAAPPEMPETLPPSVIGTSTAEFVGVLAPGVAGPVEPVEFEFRYRQVSAGTGCEGGQHVAPEPPGNVSAGNGMEPVAVEAAGLESGVEYAVCLVARGLLTHESASGPAITFVTFIPVEVPAGEQAINVTDDSATLEGLLNPHAAGSPGTYQFDYAASTSQCEEHTAPEPTGVDEGHKEELAQTTITGLLPGTTYTFCLQAEDPLERQLGAPKTFTTHPAPPTISEQTATTVGLTTATVTARINPGGAPAGYQVQYISEPQFLASGWQHATLQPSAEVALPAAVNTIPVSQQLTGLQPGTAYVFRFLASSPVSPQEPGEVTNFKTNSAITGSSTLPDDRIYELASAGYPSEIYPPAGRRAEPEAAPAEFTAAAHFPFRAAAEGNAIAYVGGPANSGGNGLTGEGVGDDILATRNGQSGWESTGIAPQIATGSELPNSTTYEWFSSDLSVGVLATISTAAFAGTTTPEGPLEECNVLYSRSNGGFHALFTQTVTPHDCGSNIAGSLAYDPRSLLFAGASADDSQMFFQTPAALISGVEDSAAGNNLYDSVDGRLSLVNVLPDGEVDPDATFGRETPFSGVVSGSEFAFGGVVSQAGSVAVWSDSMSKRIYARLNPSQRQSRLGVKGECSEPVGCTVQVSGEGPAQYRTATPDGRYVYYTEAGSLYRFDTETGGSVPLTNASYNATGTGDLTAESNEVTSLATSSGIFAVGEPVYGPSIPEGTRIIGVSGSTLTLSQAATAPGTEVSLSSGGSVVQGVIAVNETGEDGSYVYFVADGALAGNTNGQGETASTRACQPSTEEPFRSEELDGHLPSDKGCNMYVLHDGDTQFIAALTAFDGGDWTDELGGRDAQVTPDGHHLVFESRRELTAYTGGGGKKVFVFDADSAGLSCVSCNPDGVSPILGGASLVISRNPTFMHRWISQDGNRVFFDTNESLVAQDTNGVQDVYEWERPTANPEPDDSCSRSAAAFSETDRGCVFLLSGGTSSALSYFADADANGDNVFFTHRGMLGRAGAEDGMNALYDARVGGGFPESPTGCVGSGCQVAPAPPSVFTAPPTIGFDGVGNFVPALVVHKRTPAQVRAEKLAKALRACRAKRDRHRRVACEVQARRRYDPLGKAKRTAKSKDVPGRVRAGGRG